MADKQIPCSVAGCASQNLAWYETIHKGPPHMCGEHRSNAAGKCARPIHAGRGLHHHCFNRVKVTAADGFGYCNTHNPATVAQKRTEDQRRWKAKMELERLAAAVRDARSAVADLVLACDDALPPDIDRARTALVVAVAKLANVRADGSAHQGGQ